MPWFSNIPTLYYENFRTEHNHALMSFVTSMRSCESIYVMKVLKLFWREGCKPCWLRTKKMWKIMGDVWVEAYAYYAVSCRTISRIKFLHSMMQNSQKLFMMYEKVSTRYHTTTKVKCKFFGFSLVINGIASQNMHCVPGFCTVSSIFLQAGTYPSM